MLFKPAANGIRAWLPPLPYRTFWIATAALLHASYTQPIPEISYSFFPSYKARGIMRTNPKNLLRKLLPKKMIKIMEETYRKARIYILQAAKGFPARHLRIIAVTGTNGKTTTCCYINEMLKTAGYRTALYSTAVIELGGTSTLNQTHRTVPLTAKLFTFLQAAKRAKADFVILETTSMALHQHKLAGVPIEIALMTNLTQDHLDYHTTMDAYAAAKARLFSAHSKPKYTVLNHDDAWFTYFKNQSYGRVLSYGASKGSDNVISSVRTGNGQSNWRISAHGTHLQLATHLLGHFNIHNATAAASVGLLLGLSSEQIQTGIATLREVPGRMEVIDADQPFRVLVDYAHTPDALQQVLLAAHTLTTKRVLIVFGATGNRDKSKRSTMGRIAAEMADIIYLTDDEAYNEDPAAIRTAVRKGIESAHGNYVEVADRLESIKEAFKEARKGDVVILAGIGHQNTRTMGKKQLPWDERAIARQLLTNQ
jgi:UDP-N-acetylmuramyl-tripeptide synthetase